MMIAKTGALIFLTVISAAVLGHYIVVLLLKAAGSVRVDRAGRWIGYLERALVALFVLVGLTANTVFIFATKAAVIGYRIPKDGNAEKQKAEAEYMLIGSMISYLVGLLFGFIGKVARVYLCG